MRDIVVPAIELTAIVLLIVGVLIVIMVIGFREVSQGVYECIDTQGNAVECYMVIVDKGIAWGRKTDGTEVQLVEYKRLKESEE